MQRLRRGAQLMGSQIGTPPALPRLPAPSYDPCSGPRGGQACVPESAYLHAGLLPLGRAMDTYWVLAVLLLLAPCRRARRSRACPRYVCASWRPPGVAPNHTSHTHSKEEQ